MNDDKVRDLEYRIRQLEGRLSRLEYADPTSALRQPLNYLKNPIFQCNVTLPVNSASLGTFGSFCFDDNFIYLYVSTGWKRGALAAF